MVQLTERELERILVRDNLGSIDDSTIMVDELVARHGSGLVIEIDHDYHYGDCDLSIDLRVERPETDEEYEARIAKLMAHKVKAAEAARKRRETQAAKKRATETAERELYEKLKVKYGMDGS